MNRVCGQKTEVKVKAYVTAAGGSFPVPLPSSSSTKPSHNPGAEVLTFLLKCGRTGIPNMICLKQLIFFFKKLTLFLILDNLLNEDKGSKE